MSNEANKNKNDATAQKLAAALEQSSFSAVTAQLAQKPTSTAAAKNVVKISDQAAKNSVVKKKVAKKSTAKKVIAKTVAKKAVTKKVAVKSQPKQAAQVKNTATKNTAQTAKNQATNAAKQASDFAQQAAQKAQAAYSQSAETAKQLLSAKSVSQVFEIQSRAARQNFEQSLNQVLQLNQAISESISKAFSAFSSKN